MRDFITIVEGLSNFSGEWVHFSKVLHIGINPKPNHQDPLGIYFFPKEFVPANMWDGFPYKFTAKMKPDARILDLSEITEDQIDDLIDRSGARSSYDASVTRYPPATMAKRVAMAWNVLTRHYAYERDGKRAPAAFNKLFRSAGYDAIFDDTGAIHGSETQLLVLDPRIIEAVSMDQSKGSGFAEVKTVLDDVVDLCKAYGDVEIEAPKREKNHYSDDWVIVGSVTVTKNHQNAKIVIQTVTEAVGKPKKVRASIRYSSPSMGYGCGAIYVIAKKSYERFSTLDTLKQGLDTIFAEDHERWLRD